MGDLCALTPLLSIARRKPSSVPRRGRQAGVQEQDQTQPNRGPKGIGSVGYVRNHHGSFLWLVRF